MPAGPGLKPQLCPPASVHTHILSPQRGHRKSHLPGLRDPEESVDELPASSRQPRDVPVMKGMLETQTAWGAGQGGATPGAACLPQLESSGRLRPAPAWSGQGTAPAAQRGFRGPSVPVPCLPTGPRGACPVPRAWPMSLWRLVSNQVAVFTQRRWACPYSVQAGVPLWGLAAHASLSLGVSYP